MGHIRDVLCMLSRKESTLDAKQVFGLNVEHSKSFSAQLVPYVLPSREDHVLLKPPLSLLLKISRSNLISQRPNLLDNSSTSSMYYI